MKKLLLAATLFVAMQVNAQIKTPQASLKAEVEQAVGLTNVSVDYFRPAKKGRLVFGDLVPYGKMWRTGANQNTVIEIDTERDYYMSAEEAKAYGIIDSIVSKR